MKTRRTIITIIALLIFTLLFCCFSYVYGVIAIENRLEKLSDAASEHNFNKIDSMIFENADIYIENSDGTVLCDGVYEEVKDVLKKIVNDKNTNLNLTVLNVSTEFKIFSSCAKNALFFTNETNQTHGELTYEIEFSNIPFMSEIVSIKIAS